MLNKIFKRPEITEERVKIACDYMTMANGLAALSKTGDKNHDKRYRKYAMANYNNAARELGFRNIKSCIKYYEQHKVIM